MKFKRWSLVGIVVLAITMLSGCTLWNLLFGSVDYAKIEHIKDQYGRVVIYHGANHSNFSKHSPDNLPWHDGSQYKMLNEWGFNVVRFQVFWSAIEPKKDSIDFVYLNKVSAHIDAMKAVGIDVIIDWHQDLYSEKFSGNGMPDWTAHDDGFPFNEREPWHLNYREPAVIAAFTHFWKNTDNVQTECIDAIMLMLKRFGRHTNIVGLDPYNEPFPGAYVITFEPQELTNYYIELERRKIEAGSTIPLYFEPSIFSSSMVPTRLSFEPKRLAVYFPHYYDASIDYGVGDKYGKTGWRLMKEAIEIKVLEAQERKVPFMLGEFGMKSGVEGRLQFYDDMMYLADRYQFGWTVWAFDPTTYGSMGLFDPEGNEQVMMKALVRIYPQRTAGDQLRWRSSNNRFKFEYMPNRKINEPTIIFIPKRLKGIQVQVNGGELESFGGGQYEHKNVGNEKQEIRITWEE